MIAAVAPSALLAQRWLELALEGVWLGTLIAAAASLTLRALPRLRPAARHAALLATLAAVAAAPFVRAFLDGTPPPTPTARSAHVVARGAGTAPRQREAHASELPAANARREDAGSSEAGIAEHADAEHGGAAAAPASTDLTPRPVLSIESGAWVSALFLTWLVIAACLLLRLSAACVAVHRLVRSARPLPEPLAARVRALLADPSGATPPATRALLVSSAVGSPMTVGVVRVTVLLPESLAPRLTDAELRDVLLHELAHVGRRDGAAALLQRICEALLFHHPAVWWIGRRMRVERELACDDAVVRRTRAPERYVRSLVRIAELTAGVPRIAHVSGAASATHALSVRADRILAPRAPRGRRVRPASLAAGAAVLGLVAVTPAASVVERTIAAPADTARAGPRPPTVDRRSAAGSHRNALGARIDRTLRSYEAHGFSGVVLVAKDGEIVLHEGYGLADRERRVATTADTYFSTAGMTKALTAAVILLLEAEGQLRVDDALSRHLGAFPGAKRAATLHHLLTHTDGLAQPGADVARAGRDDFLAAMKSTPLAFAPGTASRYTDVGHSLLGVVLERVTGEPYERLVRRRLLEPAGMTASRFENESLPVGAVLAREYAGPVGAQAPVPPRGYVWGRRASLGLVSTAEDLYRLLLATAGGGVLPEAVRRRMLMPHVTTGHRTLQAYGWDLARGPEGAVIQRRLAGTPGLEGELLRDVTNGWDAVILVNSAVGWRYAVWGEIDAAVRGRPPAPLDSVLARRRYDPYRGGRPTPVRAASDVAF